VFEDASAVNDYEQQADDIIEHVWGIFQDDASWSQEAKSTDGIDIVMSKMFPKWGKVFRLSVRTKRDHCSTRNNRMNRSCSSYRVSFQVHAMML
jgi:hypothetical protein